MAPTGIAAAPACLLLLLAFLPSCDTRPTGTPAPEGDSFAISKQNLKQLITVLEHQIKVLHQRHLRLQNEPPRKQDKSETAHMKILKGFFLKEKTTPTSLTTQETTFFNSYSELVGNELQKISPNMDAAGGYNKEKGAETKEDTKERTLLSDLKQDRLADNDDGRSVRTTSITLPVDFHSADYSSKTQTDNYNLKDSEEITKDHVVASDVTNQGLKLDSVKLKDGGMQVVINSTANTNVKHVFEKRRKPLLKPDHGMTGKNTTEDRKINHSLTVLKPLKVIYMDKPTREPLFFEKSDPTVTSDHKDRSQSIMRQQAELSLKVLEKILCYLKEENEMQKSLSPYEKIQASIMANILQESNTQKSPGKTDSSKDILKTTLKPFLGESSTVPVSNEHSVNQTQATTVPKVGTNVTNKDVKDAKRLEEYEDAQDKKKVEDLKDVLKDITIACIVLTGFILVMMVFLVIWISLFLKKMQESVIASQNKGTQQRDCSGFLQTAENQNNNNLIFVDEESTDGDFVSENEDIAEFLKTEPVENMSFCSSPSRETDILLPAKPLAELHDCYSPSYNSTHENLSEHSRTFKTNPTSCNHPEHFEKPEDHDYKRLQEKYTASYRKDANHQSRLKHNSKFTEPKRICTACSSKHCCYCSSSRVTHFSSNASVTLGVNENINASSLSQQEGSQCACYKFLKGSSDSYSD